jgi:ribosome-associated protein
MSDSHENNESEKSKSQLKRESANLQKLGERLLELKDDQLSKLEDSRLVEAVIIARNLKSGKARKRQIQFIGKLMRNADVEAVSALLDHYDSQSIAAKQSHHKIERWREALLAGNNTVLDEIFSECSQMDRQHLMQLTRQAKRELTTGASSHSQSRKLFRYLREILDNTDPG